MPDSMHAVTSDGILSVTGLVFDAFSYHSYGVVSGRCAARRNESIVPAFGAFHGFWLPSRKSFFFA